MHRVRSLTRIALISSLLLSAGVGAKWALLGTEVPVSRLIQNVGAYVRDHPQDAQGCYVLGRVHSLAFAQEDAKMRVYYQKDLAPRQSGTPQSAASPAQELPQFPGYTSVLEGQNTPATSAKKADTLVHLLASVRNYQHATPLAPQTGLYWLGLGWMLEQAHQAQAHGGRNRRLWSAMPPPGVYRRWRRISTPTICPTHKKANMRRWPRSTTIMTDS